MEGIDVLGATILAIAHLPQSWVLFVVSFLCDGLTTKDIKLGHVWLFYILLVILLGWQAPAVSAEYQLRVADTILWIGTLLLSARLFIRAFHSAR